MPDRPKKVAGGPLPVVYESPEAIEGRRFYKRRPPPKHPEYRTAEKLCRSTSGDIVCRDGYLWQLTYSEMGPPDQRDCIGPCKYCRPGEK